MSDGFSSTDKMTELRRLNDRVNFLEYENAALRKAGEALVAINNNLVLYLEGLKIARPNRSDTIDRLLDKANKVADNWREACGE